MQVGVAASDITPKPGLLLQGHLSRNPSHTVLYPLEIRAIVFAQDGLRTAIATLDVMLAPADLTDRIRRRVQHDCKIRPDRIMIAASHTHCAPYMRESMGIQPDRSFIESVEIRTANCIADATANLAPATLGLGCGSAHFNVNREPSLTVNREGIVDRRVRVLRVDRAGAEPLAVLFHYSCHPTTMSGNQGYISPDYPGIARAAIESSLGCRALFLPGCFANVRPAIISEDGRFCSATKEQLDACGQELGQAVCDVAHYIRTEPTTALSAAVEPLKLAYGPAMPRSQLEQRVAKGELTPWARQVLGMIDQGTLPRARRSQMQRFLIGPTALVAIPGEPVQEIGHAIEKCYRGALGATDLWPVGYTNDMLGYLCTPQQHQAGGYEPNAYPHFNEPATFDGEAARIVATTGQLLNQACPNAEAEFTTT